MIQFNEATTINSLMEAVRSVKGDPRLLSHREAQVFKTEVTIIASFCRDLGFIGTREYNKLISQLKEYPVQPSGPLSSRIHRPLPTLEVPGDRAISGDTETLALIWAIESATVLNEIKGMPDMAFEQAKSAWIDIAAQIAAESEFLGPVAAETLAELKHKADRSHRVSFRTDKPRLGDPKIKIKYFRPFVLEVMCLINPTRRIDLANLAITETNLAISDLASSNSPEDQLTLIANLSYEAIQRLRLVPLNQNGIDRPYGYDVTDRIEYLEIVKEKVEACLLGSNNFADIDPAPLVPEHWRHLARTTPMQDQPRRRIFRPIRRKTRQVPKV